MKFFLLLGGFLGFVLTFAASWNADNAPAQALCDAAIGCLAGALLFRGLHFVLMTTVRHHIAGQPARENADSRNAGAVI